MSKFFEKKNIELGYADCLFILNALKIYISIRAIENNYDCWSYSVLEELLSKFEVIMNNDKE